MLENTIKRKVSFFYWFSPLIITVITVFSKWVKTLMDTSVFLHLWSTSTFVATQNLTLKSSFILCSCWLIFNPYYPFLESFICQLFLNKEKKNFFKKLRILLLNIHQYQAVIDTSSITACCLILIVQFICVIWVL